MAYYDKQFSFTQKLSFFQQILYPNSNGNNQNRKDKRNAIVGGQLPGEESSPQQPA